jgi:hypothetical protein
MKRRKIDGLRNVDTALRSRLINWKFESALKYVDEFGEDEEAREVLEALARLHGNSGWTQGDLALIISVAVDMLLGRF